MSDNPDRGAVELLGIYGHSAYHNPPANYVAFDVNQIPMMFFDYRPVRKGNIMLGVRIDGQLLKDFADHGEEGVHTDVDPAKIEDRQVKRRAQDFWVPQKYRTVGRHKVELLAGYTEEYRDILFRLRSRTVWNTTKMCILEFTGQKMGGD